jgi:hypothetical protein
VGLASLGVAGDFSSGAARSIRVVGGWLFPAALPVVVLLLGVALSIADVGGCLRGFAWLVLASDLAVVSVGPACWTGWSMFEAPSFVAPVGPAAHTQNVMADVSAATVDAIRSLFIFTSGTM